MVAYINDFGLMMIRRSAFCVLLLLCIRPNGNKACHRHLLTACGYPAELRLVSGLSRFWWRASFSGDVRHFGDLRNSSLPAFGVPCNSAAARLFDGNFCRKSTGLII